jgi:hypothetical protein
MDINVADLNDDDLVKYAAHFANEVEQAKAKADEAKAEIRKRFNGHRLLKSPCGIEVKLSYPRKFDPKLAEQMLMPAELARITVPTISGTLAKQVLSPEDYLVVTYADTPRVGFKVL